MSQVKYDGQVTINSMHGDFGFQSSPSFSATDYLQGSPIERDANSGLVYDPALDCSYNQVVSVPYDQLYTGGPGIVDVGNNTLWPIGAGALYTNWTLTGTSATLNGHAYKFAPWGCEYAVFQSSNSSGENLTATNILSNNSLYDGYGEQGYDLYISKYLYSPLGSGDSSSWLIWFFLTDLQTGWGVQALSSGVVNIVQTYDGGQNYVALKSQMPSTTPIGAIAGNTLPSSADLLTHIRAVAMGDSVSIRINDGLPFTSQVLNRNVDYSYPAGVAPDYATVKFPRFGMVGINIVNFSTCAFCGWPLKWLASTSYTSGRYSNGGEVDTSNPPYFYVRSVDSITKVDNGGTIDLSLVNANPSGSNVTVQIAPDSFYEAAPQFLLQVNMPQSGTWADLNFSNHTACLTGVSINYDGSYDGSEVGSGHPLPLNVDAQYTPKAMTLSESFSLSSLSINRSATVTLDEWYGIDDLRTNVFIPGALGEASIGNFAIALSFGYLGGDLIPRFSGYVDTIEENRDGPGEATITFIATDRMQQLAESWIFDPPNFDGYYHYYVIQYCAEFAGIPPNQLFFYTYDSDGNQIQISAQSDPFTADPNDPDPWFLPIGTAGHPWTPIQRQFPVLELMEFVRKTAGCVLLFDQIGLLEYGPWIPPTNSAPPVKTFYEGPVPVTDQELDLNECWNIKVRMSTRNTKTQVTTISIDPYRPGTIDARTIARSDGNVQVTSNYTAQPYNYKGFVSASAISDPRFGFHDFRVRATNNYYRVMSQPDVTVQFTTWMQVDLNILDIIYVNDSRSNIYGVPLTITNHSIILSANDQVPRSSFVASYYYWPSPAEIGSY